MPDERDDVARGKDDQMTGQSPGNLEPESESTDPTMREQVEWWLGGPGMSQLGLFLILVAGAGFVLAMAERWPPHLSALATRMLGGLVCMLFGWVIAPFVTLSFAPVRMVSKKNGCLGWIASQIWDLVFLIAFVLFVGALGFHPWVMLGFGGGLLLRWTLPLIDPPSRDPVRSVASMSVMIAALCALAMAEFAALGWWFAAGDPLALRAWMIITAAVPAILGFLLKSRVWPFLVFLLTFVSAMAVSAWAQPPVDPARSDIPIAPIGDLPNSQVLAIGLLGMVTAVAAVWIARQLAQGRQDAGR